MISNFPRIVKKHLKHLPQDDYPALNTFLFVSTWLSFALDQSQISMRSLFKRLNVRGIDIDISTFSKASKVRDPAVFSHLFEKLREELKEEHKLDSKKLALFPLDSTIVTLTSKLLWSQGYHQVKLFSGLNLLTAEPGGIAIHFGQGHDSKYGGSTIKATPANGVSIMDRGFSSFARIKALMTEKDRYFLLRIKNNIYLKMLENENFLIGVGAEQVEARVVNFCDLEEKREFRFVTNLPINGEFKINNQ